MALEKLPIAKIRSETPGLNQGIFLNSAGASLRNQKITKVVKDYLDNEDLVGGHEAARQSKPRLEAVYSSIEKLANANPGEIALTESHTHGWHAIVSALSLQAGDEIIVTKAEYISGLTAIMELRQRLGVSITIIDYDEAGLVDLAQLEKALSSRTKLVCLTHIATSNGTVHPVAKAGEIIRRRSNAFYLLDVAQSIGQMKVDVKDIGCHGLTATGRKFLRSPRGTGFLYVETAALRKLRPLLPDGHKSILCKNGKVSIVEDTRSLELFEKSVANFLGLGAAVDYTLALGIEKIEARISKLVEIFRSSLAGIEGIRVGEASSSVSGLVTVYSSVKSSSELANTLIEENISFKMIQNQDGAMDFSARQLNDVIRLSLHYFNTESELLTVADRFQSLMKC